jgi:hypothetical protein
LNFKEIGVEGLCEYGSEPAISVDDVGAMTVCQQ